MYLYETQGLDLSWVCVIWPVVHVFDVSSYMFAKLYAWKVISEIQ